MTMGSENRANYDRRRWQKIDYDKSRSNKIWQNHHNITQQTSGHHLASVPVSLLSTCHMELRIVASHSNARLQLPKYANATILTDLKEIREFPWTIWKVERILVNICQTICKSLVLFMHVHAASYHNASAWQVQGVANSGGSAGSIPAVQLVLQEAQCSFFWKPVVLSVCQILSCVVLVSLMSAFATCPNLSVTSASLAVYQHDQSGS